MSDATPAVYQAICCVQAELAHAGIAKDRKNQQQGYSFRGIDDVYNSLSPLLAKHQLCILPRVLSFEVSERETQKGGVLFYTRIRCDFDFVSAKDGSKHTVTTLGEAMDSGDKSGNKAQSAAYKYACLQTFAIPTEGDNDADAHTHEVAPRQNAAPAAKPPPAVPMADRAAAAMKKLDAALDAQDYEAGKGILAFAGSPSGLDSNWLSVLRQYAVQAIIDRLEKDHNLPVVANNWRSLLLISDEDHAMIQDRAAELREVVTV